MANKRITQLELASSVTDAFNIPGDNTTQTFRFTAPQLYAYMQGFGLIDTYQVGRTYALNAFVVSSGVLYRSLQGSNVGNTPSSSPTYWIPYSPNNAYSGKSADYTITDTDGYGAVGVTTSSTTRTITLPDATKNLDRTLFIGKVDSGTGGVILDGHSTQLIGSVQTLTISKIGDWVQIKSNGSNWVMLSSHISASNVISAYQSTGANMSSATYVPMLGVQLTPGFWQVQGCVMFSRNGASVSSNSLISFLAGNTSNNNTGLYNASTGMNEDAGTFPTSYGTVCQLTPMVFCKYDGTDLTMYDNSSPTVTATNQVTLKVYSGTWTSGPVQASGSLRAYKIGDIV